MSHLRPGDTMVHPYLTAVVTVVAVTGDDVVVLTTDRGQVWVTRLEESLAWDGWTLIRMEEGTAP